MKEHRDIYTALINAMYSKLNATSEEKTNGIHKTLIKLGWTPPDDHHQCIKDALAAERTDLKAARLLELDCYASWKDGLSIDNTNAGYISVGGSVFSLDDAATRDAVVQALGEKHGIDFGYNRLLQYWSAWHHGPTPHTYVAEDCCTYTEALRHAVDKVIGNE